jgi:hypothetical protein
MYILGWLIIGLYPPQLVPLPRDPTVTAILQKYKQTRSKGLPAYVGQAGTDLDLVWVLKALNGCKTSGTLYRFLIFKEPQ